MGDDEESGQSSLARSREIRRAARERRAAASTDASDPSVTDVPESVPAPVVTVPPRPPVPKKPRVPWSAWAAEQKTAVITLSIVAALAIVGGVIATVFAVTNYQNWASVVADRDALAVQVTDLDHELSATGAELASAQDALLPQEQTIQREKDVTVREGGLQSREDKVKAREDAIAAKEQYIQQTSLKPGNYTVGVSMEAGVYRTESTSARCYWEIDTSGTNYEDIVANDLGATGVLTVNVNPGQDFQSHDCGTWTKVG